MSEQFKIVGMYFRDKEGTPASLILNSLPGNCKLVLYREPENAFDPNAMQVLVRPADFKDNEASIDRLTEGLVNWGVELDDILGREYIHLGYIPRDTASAELLSRLDEAIEAYLTFGADGKANVIVY